MAEFNNPFPGTKSAVNYNDMLNAIRLDIANEYEAISTYDSQIRMTDDLLIKEVLTSIRDEEKVHVGELHNLLHTLSEIDSIKFNEGIGEVNEIKEKTGVKDEDVGDENPNDEEDETESYDSSFSLENILNI